MAVFIGKLNAVNFLFENSEFAAGKVPGIGIVGAICLEIDTGYYWIVGDDLVLVRYYLPSGDTIDIGDVQIIAGSALIGNVGIDQVTANANEVVVKSITAGETHVGSVGGESIAVSQTPTVTSGSYSANDAVGGLLTFANAGRVAEGSGVLKNVLIIDDAGQDAVLELWLFNATFTAMADNAAWAPSQADLRKLIAVISTNDGDWFAAGTPSVARVEVSQNYNLAAAGTSLFGQLVTRGTPTFAATDDVSIIIQLLQD